MTKVGDGRYDTAGAVHEIPLPDDVPGALFLCGFGVIGPDPVAALDFVQGDLAVCLLTTKGIVRRFPDYLDWLAHPQPAEAIHVEIEDYHVTDDATMIELVDTVAARLRNGTRVLAHCGAGWGRAGQLTVGVLLALGAADLSSAVTHLRRHRPGAGPESDPQHTQLAHLEAHYR